MKPKIRLPLKDGTAMEAVFRTRFPYAVAYRAVLDGRTATDEEIEKAGAWATRCEYDFEWNSAGMFFRKEEHAVLFKMGLWLNEDLLD